MSVHYSSQYNDLQEGSVYSGFELLQRRDIPTLQLTMLLFKHQGCHAKLLKLQCADPHRTFCVTVNTPLDSSKGVTELLRQMCLAGGGRNYSSQALTRIFHFSTNHQFQSETLPDRTYYLFSGTNEPHFTQGMLLLMDSLFFPTSLSDEALFKRFAWHYSLDTPGNQAVIRGNLYEKVKRYSKIPMYRADVSLNASLFGSSPYGYPVLGDPVELITLSTNDLAEYHSRFYHPSNSLFYLYGNGNISEELKTLADHYFDSFETVLPTAKCSLPTPLTHPDTRRVQVDVRVPYSEESPYFHAFSWALEHTADPLKHAGFAMLDLLFRTHYFEDLQAAIDRTEFRSDLSFTFKTSCPYPTFTFFLENSLSSHSDRCLSFIFECFSHWCEHGFEVHFVERALQEYELRYREARYLGDDHGYAYYEMLIDPWLYHDEPFRAMDWEVSQNGLKDCLYSTHYLEKLLHQGFVDNAFRASCFIDLRAPEEPAIELQQTTSPASDMVASSDKISAQARENQRILASLKKWEKTTQPPTKSPFTTPLSVNSQSPIGYPPVRHEYLGDASLYYIPQPTKGVIYFHLAYDASVIPSEFAGLLRFLADIILYLGTTPHFVNEVNFMIEQHCTKLGTFVEPIIFNNDPDMFNPFFTIEGYTTVERFSTVIAIIEEIIWGTEYHFTEATSSFAEQLLAFTKENVLASQEQCIITRVRSQLSQSGYFREQANGFSYIPFLQKKVIHSMASGKSAKLMRNVENMVAHLFRAQNLVIGVSADECHYDYVRETLRPFIAGHPSREARHYEFNYSLEPYNEGLLTPQNADMVCWGAKFGKAGRGYSGAMKVVEQIINDAFFKERVIEKTLAAKAQCRFIPSGLFYILAANVAYPVRMETALRGLPRFLRSFCKDSSRLQRYIARAIAQLDSPVPMFYKSQDLFHHVLTGKTEESFISERKQILGTTAKDIIKIADLVSSCQRKSTTILYGGASFVPALSSMIDVMRHIFD